MSVMMLTKRLCLRSLNHNHDSSACFRTCLFRVSLLLVILAHTLHCHFSPTCMIMSSIKESICRLVLFLASIFDSSSSASSVPECLNLMWFTMLVVVPPMQVDFFPHRLQWARLGFSDDLGVKIGHHDDDDCGLGMVVRGHFATIDWNRFPNQI